MLTIIDFYVKKLATPHLQSFVKVKEMRQKEKIAQLKGIIGVSLSDFILQNENKK